MSASCIWERINIYSEISSMVSAIILAPLLLFLISDEWVRLGIMALGSTLVVIITTLITPAVQDETLKHFFKKVQPAGFWKKTAKKAGADPKIPIKKFYTALTMIGFVSVSLFAALCGFGKLMFPIPNESLMWSIVSFGIMFLCGYTGWRLFQNAKNIT